MDWQAVKGNVTSSTTVPPATIPQSPLASLSLHTLPSLPVLLGLCKYSRDSIKQRVLLKIPVSGHFDLQTAARWYPRYLWRCTDRGGQAQQGSSGCRDGGDHSHHWRKWEMSKNPFSSKLSSWYKSSATWLENDSRAKTDSTAGGLPGNYHKDSESPDWSRWCLWWGWSMWRWCANTTKWTKKGPPLEEEGGGWGWVKGLRTGHPLTWGQAQEDE